MLFKLRARYNKAVKEFRMQNIYSVYKGDLL